jgi:hypothetical protein
MSKSFITKAAAVAALSIVAVAGPASAAILADQPFDSGTGDWTEYGATIAPDSGTLRVTGTGTNYGAFSYFDGVTAESGTERTTPLGLGYIAEIDAYLDPASIAVGEGFDLTVAASKTDGDHRRDFIFHVGGTEDGLLVNGSNNTDFRVNEYKLRNDNDGNFYTVPEAGWYTFQHSFYEKDGALAVDLNLLDANGDLLWKATRTNSADIATEVGGARYQWLTVVTGSFAFDNQSLERVELTPVLTSKDQCKSDWESFDFQNQGQCIASLVANEKAGK